MSPEFLNSWGLTGSSADAVIRLFSAPARVLGTMCVFSAVLLGLGLEPS